MLFTIGLVFMAVAATDYVMGSTQQIIRLPRWLQGRFEVAGVAVGRYRLFVILLCGVLVLALQYAFTKTRFGAASGLRWMMRVSHAGLEFRSTSSLPSPLPSAPALPVSVVRWAWS